MSSQRFSTAACEHCSGHIEFPAEGLGMRVACPHCSLETTLTEMLEAPAAQGSPISAAELKEALQGSLPRRRISVLYQAELALVALFMVLLPIAYLAFVCLVGYGVYWYAAHAYVMFTRWGGGAYVLLAKIVIYFAPLLAGIAAVFFMFKPLLAGRRKHVQPIELNPAEHQRLYQFIAGISDLLKVKMPARIYLDCELNASAGFKEGWASLLKNDRVLTIGLPLMIGLNTRQFAGVIAHELGHCTQSFAMRLGYIINRVDGWFFRVVHERDTWDEALSEYENEAEDWKATLIVWCVAMAVWLSRGVLLLLMTIGHAASCFLSRQMEYHADACASAVAGSATTESFLIRLRELAMIHDLGYSFLTKFWTNKRLLPDSHAEFFDILEQRLPANFHEDARLTLLNESSRLLATHPTPAQRIRMARQRSDPGVFFMERPARDLISDFSKASKIVTAQYYGKELRLPVTNRMLRPASEFFAGPSTPNSTGVQLERRNAVQTDASS